MAKSTVLKPPTFRSQAMLAFPPALSKASQEVSCPVAYLLLPLTLLSGFMFKYKQRLALSSTVNWNHLKGGVFIELPHSYVPQSCFKNVLWKLLEEGSWTQCVTVCREQSEENPQLNGFLESWEGPPLTPTQDCRTTPKAKTQEDPWGRTCCNTNNLTFQETEETHQFTYITPETKISPCFFQSLYDRQWSHKDEHKKKYSGSQMGQNECQCHLCLHSNCLLETKY